MTLRVTNYEQAIEFLFQRINYERASVGSYSTNDLKLERMSTFLEKIGNPQLTFPAMHLAGTKGKGSTATMLASVLQEAGYKVGLFTSPHLHVFEERMVVNSKMPTQEELVQLLNELLPVLDEMDHLPGEMAPTYFEIATALAWKFFQMQEAEVVVLETGLGGRLDTTKLCVPILTFITSIGLDHTNLLGETFEEIASEKAGIIKKGVPVISGVLEPGAQHVVERVAENFDAPIFQLEREFKINSSKIRWNSQSGLESHLEVLGLNGDITELQLALPGEHQGHNAALVVTAVELLQEAGWEISLSDLQIGISKTVCPLRTEVMQTSPALILDAAHNVASVSALLKTLSIIPAGKKTVVFSAALDKDAEAMLELLGHQFQRIILTEFKENPRATPIADLEKLAEKLGLSSWETASDPQTALEMVKRNWSPEELVCVTGSFYLAVEMRELLQSN